METLRNIRLYLTIILYFRQRYKREKKQKTNENSLVFCVYFVNYYPLLTKLNIRSNTAVLLIKPLGQTGATL